MAEHSRNEASRQKWADPEIRQRIIEGQRRYWSDPTVRKLRGQIAKAALAPAEVRKRISEGTKNAYLDLEVKSRLSKGLKGVWANNPKRRQQARATAIKNFSNPEVIARQKAGHAKAETRQKISDAGLQTWNGNEERREATRQMMLERWANLKKKKGGRRKKAERDRLILTLSQKVDPRTGKKFSAGKIAQKMNMTRGAVEQVIRRARRAESN